VSAYHNHETLLQNYLAMLGKTSDLHNSSSDVPSVNVVGPQEMSTHKPVFENEVERMIGEYILLSPGSSCSDLSYDEDLAEPVIPVSSSVFDMEQFLTSPAMSTPGLTNLGDDFNSPYESPLDDFLNTPIMDWIDGATDFGDANSVLFPDQHDYVEQPAVAVEPKKTPSILDSLIPITPDTPALDSFSADTSPNFPVSHSFDAPQDITVATAHVPRRHQPSATGTRKNITPASLIPLDAPTQTRNYLAPSATSRKEVPASFKNKRSASEAFGDDEELGELPPNATEKEQIEYKRRQNTLAARKSRRRKLEYTQNLEQENESLRLENERLRTQVETMKTLIERGGFTMPAS
jgi:hypothetical protein